MRGFSVGRIPRETLMDTRLLNDSAMSQPGTIIASQNKGVASLYSDFFPKRCKDHVTRVAGGVT